MPYEITAFEHVLNATPGTRVLDVIFVPAPLDKSNASLAAGARVVCLYATDQADSRLLGRLRALGVELVALRYAGVGSLDLEKASEIGMLVSRVPAHAPTSIAEYTVGLMLTLNRKIHISYNRVQQGNMTLNGLVGFDMASKTVGIIGTGKVGRIVARILRGFGCKVLAFDMIESKEVIDLGGRYVSMGMLLASSDILTLHAPLVPGTYHLIGKQTLPRCKAGVHIVNTSRGGLIDVRAAIDAMQTGQLGALAIDVYEGESSCFYGDHTGENFEQDFQLLKSMPNVLITGNQSSLTNSALQSVARATIHTFMQFHAGEDLEYGISVKTKTPGKAPQPGKTQLQRQGVIRPG